MYFLCVCALMSILQQRRIVNSQAIAVYATLCASMYTIYIHVIWLKVFAWNHIEKGSKYAQRETREETKKSTRNQESTHEPRIQRGKKAPFAR